MGYGITFAPLVPPEVLSVGLPSDANTMTSAFDRFGNRERALTSASSQFVYPLPSVASIALVITVASSVNVWTMTATSSNDTSASWD